MGYSSLISENDVFMAITELSATHTARLDSVPSSLIKILFSVLVTTLMRIFNIGLKSGTSECLESYKNI